METITHKKGDTFLKTCTTDVPLTGYSIASHIRDAADASTGNLYFMHNNGSGVADKVDLGVNAARSLTTHGFELIMFAAPNSAVVNVFIQNLHTGVVLLDTSYTTKIPAVNTGLAFKCEVRNGAIAAADNIECAKVYIESDY